MASLETVNKLIDMGFVVIPVYAVGPDGTCKCPRGRRCSAPGKHPVGDGWESQSQQEALEAFERLGSSTTSTRPYNVGILVGPSGLLVVDVDPRNGGTESMRKFSEEHGRFGASRVVNTGSGGWHYYTRRPEGVDFKGTLGSEYPGVDIKTTGMVVAEGSASSTGEYTLRDDSPVAETPESVVECARRAEPTPGRTRNHEGVDANDPDLPRRQAWCRSGVQKEIDRLKAMDAAKVPSGVGYGGDPWDNTTHAVACNLLEFANTPEAGMTEQDVIDLVHEYAPQDSGFTTDDINRIIRSARSKVGDGSKSIPEQFTNPFVGGSPEPGVGSAPDPIQMEPIDRMVGRLWKDAHVAEAFAEHHAGELRHIPGKNGWLRWSSIEGRWDPVDDGMVSDMSNTFAQELSFGATRLSDPALAKAASGRLGKSAISNVALLAADRRALSVSLSDLDGDPELLNCTNGYVDLRTGELYPHDPDKMMTRTTGVMYKPNATHEDVDAALSCLDPDERRWFQLAAGQALTGYLPPDDFITFLHGVGANGKTALVSALRRVAGSYGTTMSEKVLLASGQAHTTDMTDLRDIRVAILEELPEGGNLNMERVKKVAGSETMKARRMKQDNMEWEPTHTIFVTTNHRPKVAETDHGTWRRLVLLNFPYRYVRSAELVEGARDRVGDRGLRRRLSGEAQKEAFLAWCIRGAVEFLSGGDQPLEPTETMQADMDDWRGSSDPLGRFMDDQIDFCPESFIATSDFFEEFKAFLMANGHPAWSSQLVAARVEGHHRAIANNVRKSQIRVGLEKSISPRPGPVHVEYANGQKVRVWQGMKWKEQDHGTLEVAP